LVGCFVSWLVGRVGRLTELTHTRLGHPRHHRSGRTQAIVGSHPHDRHIDRQTHRLACRCAHPHAHRLPTSQRKPTKTHTQADRQTDRHTHTHKHTNTHEHAHTPVPQLRGAPRSRARAPPPSPSSGCARSAITTKHNYGKTWKTRSHMCMVSPRTNLLLLSSPLRAAPSPPSDALARCSCAALVRVARTHPPQPACRRRGRGLAQELAGARRLVLAEEEVGVVVVAAAASTGAALCRSRALLRAPRALALAASEVGRCATSGCALPDCRVP
jgi:hypothetical protein